MSTDRSSQASRPSFASTDPRSNDFLATLGHELRDPLSALRNALAVLQRAGVPEATFRQARDIAARQTEHLVTVVENFLDLGRLDHGKLKLQRNRVLVADVVRQAVEIARPLIDSHQHRLTVVLPPVPLFVDGDFVRLTQVLSNVVHNAVKYTDAGGRIAIRLEGIGDEAVIRVADNGIGIGAEALPHVFDRFAQAASGIGHRVGGLGLGLAVSSRIVRQLGGRIEATSDGELKGSQFVIRLPLAPPLPADAAGARGSPLLPVSRVAASAPNRRVLLVDDSLGAAESIAMLAKLGGNEVSWTLDADTGLALAGDLDPHVVVLDLESLNGEAYGFARLLRDRHGDKPIVVGMLTSSPHARDRRRARLAGLDHCLAKPIDAHGWSALLAASPAGRDADGRLPAPPAPALDTWT